MAQMVKNVRDTEPPYFLFHHKHVALKSEHQHFKVWLMHVGDINRPVHVYTRTDPS